MKRGRQLGIGRGSGRAHHADQVGPARFELARVRSDRGPETAPDPVARHRTPGPTADGVGDARRFRRRPDDCAGHHDNTSAPAPARSQRAKRRPFTNRPDQADRRERPLVRRRRRTARPAFVRIRRRKPCFLLRRRLFGWNVLFTHGLLERPGHPRGWGALRRVPRIDTGAPAHTATTEGLRRRGHGARTAWQSTAPPSDRTIAPARARPPAPNWTLAGLSTALIRSAAPSVRVTGTRLLPPQSARRTAAESFCRPCFVHTCGHTCGQPLGSRHRGDTCR
jgi:hypothetical protein